MPMRSAFHQVDRNLEHNIVWIEDDCDANGDAKMTVTNDAENVLAHFRHRYGKHVRVVYRDTNMEWWEIVWDPQTEFTARFLPWYGLVWDRLQSST